MIRALDSLLRTCVPTSSVFVAMDGPGPMAKMMTQRRRRFVKSGPGSGSDQTVAAEFGIDAHEHERVQVVVGEDGEGEDCEEMGDEEMEEEEGDCQEEEEEENQ